MLATILQYAAIAAAVIVPTVLVVFLFRFFYVAYFAVSVATLGKVAMSHVIKHVLQPETKSGAPEFSITGSTIPRLLEMFLFKPIPRYVELMGMYHVYTPLDMRKFARTIVNELPEDVEMLRFHPHFHMKDTQENVANCYALGDNFARQWKATRAEGIDVEDIHFGYHPKHGLWIKNCGSKEALPLFVNNKV